jgi:hypothetical protein
MLWASSPEVADRHSCAKEFAGVVLQVHAFCSKSGFAHFFLSDLCFFNGESIVKVITIKLFGLYNCGTYLLFWQYFPEHSGRFCVSSCL